MRKRLVTLVGACFGAALLAACGGANTGLSPANSALTAGADSRAAIKQVQIAANSCCDIAVDPVTNLVYVSAGGHIPRNDTTVVDGSSFSIVANVAGFGGAYNVDVKTRNVWLPGLYSGKVEVYSGSTLSRVATVALQDCPVASWVDSNRRQAWIAAQCGGGNDPIWAVDADTYKVVAGPIGTRGVMGLTVLNSATGRFYVQNSAGNFVVDPVTFKFSKTSFGNVLRADSVIDLLYAQVPGGLNIVDGRTDKIKKTLSLSYLPAFVGINAHLNHVYLSSGKNSVEVREGNAGALLKTIQLASGIGVLSLGADQLRARIYAVGTSGGNYYLYEIADKF